MIATIALVLGAIPALALAQSPFRDYKQAAGDQYGTTTTTTPTSSVDATVSTPVATATVGATVGSEAQPPEEEAESPSQEEGAAESPNAGESPSQAGAGKAGTGAAGAGAGASGDDGPSCNRYAIIGLSPLLDPAVPDVVEALGKAAYVADVTEPLNTGKLKSLTDGTEWEGAATDLAKLRAFAKALGASVPDAGELARKAFPNQLAKLPDYPPNITDQDFEPVAGIVLTHVEVPLNGDEDDRRDAFVKAFIEGLQTVKVPDVNGGEVDLALAGVEEKVTKDSEIPFFKNLDVSSIDNVDQADGKVSLIRVMFGADGHFGVKDTADDGKLAKASDEPAPLLCRPDNKYVPTELLRSTDDGIPGGGMTIGVMLILGIAAAFSMVAIVERRTRRLRHRTR